MIDRAEAQLKSSPKSTQIHQTLLDYYKAANDKEKFKATAQRMTELKPDDARLRYQIAQQLQTMGEKQALPSITSRSSNWIRACTPTILMRSIGYFRN